MRRVSWLDTLRVWAALFVLLGHYSYIAHSSPAVHHFLYAYFVDLGQVGNMLFFAVSGYLAANSLENSSDTLEFYRRRIIRLTIPYAAAYLILAVLLAVLGIFEPQLLNHSPVQNIDLTTILFGMLPLASDFNLINFFQIPIQIFTEESFVGEWFMATIIYLYLISPLLYKFLRWNCALTVLVSVVIAGLAFNLELGLQNAGYIFGNRSFFLIRIPEFLLGMVLFLYKGEISQNHRSLTGIFFILAIFLLLHSIFFNHSDESIWVRIFFNSAVNAYRQPIDAAPLNEWKYLLADIIIVYFAYRAAFYLNQNFSSIMTNFNSFNNITYLALLMNRVVIYRFWWLYDFSALDKFETAIIFAAILLTIIFFSELIWRICKPIEDKLIQGRLLLE